VLELEFNRYNLSGSGVLSPVEFALYLTGFAPQSKHEQFLARAEAVRGSPAIAGGVSKEDFMRFSDVVQHVDQLVVRLLLSVAPSVSFCPSPCLPPVSHPVPSLFPSLFASPSLPPIPPVPLPCGHRCTCCFRPPLISCLATLTA
jgi:hypothetical protein